jgi:hypothetical protein
MGKITLVKYSEIANFTRNAIFASLGVFYLWFSYIATAYHLPYIPLCPLYLITSIHCPLCGMTRSFGELLHGNVGLALTYNSFSLILFILWLGFTATFSFYLWKDIRLWRKESHEPFHRSL